MQPNPSFWRGKSVCVTGGSGFLGWHIVGRLVGLGSHVRIFSLPPRADHPIRELPSVERFEGSICDRALLQQAMAGCDVVFHTAGCVAVWGPALRVMDAINVEGSANVIAMAEASARVVHTSSIVAVGGARDGAPLNESSRFTLARMPVDYVRTKRAAEELVLAAAAKGRDVVVTNPGYLVGPDDPEGSVMGRLCQRFWRGRVPIAPPGGFNFVDVRDVATGHLLAAERGQSGRRYILGGENHSLKVFLNMLATAADWQPRALPAMPIWLMSVFAEISELRARFTRKEPYPSRQGNRINRFRWYVSSDRAARELDYRARPLDTTIRDTYEWYSRGDMGRLRGVNRWWLRPAA